MSELHTMMLDSNTQQTVNSFLKQLGFEDFNWQGEMLTLSFEHLGDLKIELTNLGLLVARLRHINEYDIETLVPKALRAVHYDQQLPYPVRTGMSGHNQLVFLVTLRREQVTVSNLTEALSVLDFLHQQVNE